MRLLLAALFLVCVGIWGTWNLGKAMWIALNEPFDDGEDKN